MKSRRVFLITISLAACMVLLCMSACTCSSQQVAEATKDGLYLRLTTDKRTYEQGQKVIISARVENRSSEPVDWEGDGDDILISIYVGPPEHLYSTYRGALLSNDGIQYDGVTFGYHTSGTLNAGETISREIFWDQTLRLKTEAKLVQVLPDEYTIGATFWLEGERDVLPLDPLTTSLTVEIR